MVKSSKCTLRREHSELNGPRQVVKEGLSHGTR